MGLSGVEFSSCLCQVWVLVSGVWSGGVSLLWSAIMVSTCDFGWGELSVWFIRQYVPVKLTLVMSVYVMVQTYLIQLIVADEIFVLCTKCVAFINSVS
jgi:hypothetical protein